DAVLVDQLLAAAGTATAGGADLPGGARRRRLGGTLDLRDPDAGAVAVHRRCLRTEGARRLADRLRGRLPPPLRRAAVRSRAAVVRPSRRGEDGWSVMATIVALARSDLRQLRRESLMISLVLAPLGWIAMVRFGTPPVSDLVGDRYGVDLAPYHPLILTGFLLLTSPVVVGAMGAFLVLDERDARTITALRVTPTRMTTYVGYRAVVVVVVTAVYVVATMVASGLLPFDQVAALVPV